MLGRRDLGRELQQDFPGLSQSEGTVLDVTWEGKSQWKILSHTAQTADMLFTQGWSSIV